MNFRILKGRNTWNYIFQRIVHLLSQPQSILATGAQLQDGTYVLESFLFPGLYIFGLFQLKGPLPNQPENDSTGQKQRIKQTIYIQYL